jgi:uncharacterized protein (DUF1919 family)
VLKRNSKRYSLSLTKNALTNIIKKAKKIFDVFKYRKLKGLEPFTLISNNCIAGFLYQDFNIKYYSPTIGLQFSQEDFVKLCSNFWYHINCKIEESENKKQEIFTSLGGGEIDFPVGKIDDIIIYFQHYKTFENAKEKWDERKLRINKDKLFFIFIVYNNTPIETIKKFESLPFKNKLIITNDINYISSISFALHNGKNPWYDKINRKTSSKKYYEKYNFYNWIIKNCNRKNGA